MKNNYKIKWREIIDSTNSELHREMENLDNLSVVAAGYQTAGRGQRGNKWLSQAWQNLTFSILLKLEEHQISASNQFIISKIATLSIYSYLKAKDIDCQIKWPNDIYVRNKKICGMLIENVLTGSDVSRSIIGIGLNVNQMEFSPELMNPTSMKQITGLTYDVHEELPELMNHFCHYLSMYLDTERQPEEQLHDRIDAEYLEHLYRLDEWHPYRDLKTQTVFEGKIQEISPDGQLIVASSDGKNHYFTFKEIGYIL